MGPGLCSTDLIELTEISSLKTIVYKSQGGGGRLCGSQFLFSLSFLKFSSSVTSNMEITEYQYSPGYSDGTVLELHFEEIKSFHFDPLLPP